MPVDGRRRDVHAAVERAVEAVAGRAEREVVGLVVGHLVVGDLQDRGARLRRDEEVGREDLLRREGEQWKLARRTILVDESVIRMQNLAIFL